MNRLARCLPLVLLVLVAIGIEASGVTRYLNLDTLRFHEVALQGFIGAHRLLALAAFIGLYMVATVSCLPGVTTIFTVAGGYLFGTWMGGAATVIGATLGAAIVFFAVRTSLGAILREKAERSGGRLKAVIEGVGKDAFGYILTLRLIPLVPFWLVNVAAALAGAPTRAYVLATFLGIMPATFIYSGVGAGLGLVVAHGRTPSLGVILEPGLFLPLAALGLLALATTLFQRFRKRSDVAA